MVGNLLWVILQAPLFVKPGKLETPPFFMLILSMSLWYFFALFLISLLISKTGGVTYDTWYKGLVDDPYSVFNKPFAIGLMTLSAYYLFVTINNLWDFKEMIRYIKEGDEEISDSPDDGLE